jgi:hypothetical protein
VCQIDDRSPTGGDTDRDQPGPSVIGCSFAAGALASGTPPASLIPTAQPTAQPRGTLPFTGFDLLPEVLVGAALIAAGAGIQVVLRIRRA